MAAQYLLIFHNGGPYHIETSPLICSTDQWTGYYLIGKELVTMI